MNGRSKMKFDIMASLVNKAENFHFISVRRAKALAESGFVEYITLNITNPDNPKQIAVRVTNSGKHFYNYYKVKQEGEQK